MGVEVLVLGKAGAGRDCRTGQVLALIFGLCWDIRWYIVFIPNDDVEYLMARTSLRVQSFTRSSPLYLEVFVPGAPSRRSTSPGHARCIIQGYSRQPHPRSTHRPGSPSVTAAIHHGPALGVLPPASRTPGSSPRTPRLLPPDPASSKSGDLNSPRWRTTGTPSCVEKGVRHVEGAGDPQSQRQRHASRSPVSPTVRPSIVRDS